MENVKSTACKHTKSSNVAYRLDESSAYKMDGKTFIVEPVFKQDAKETIGTILVNLMRTDASRR